jgi:hypothetical protein
MGTWTSVELDVLREGYPTRGLEWCATALGRTVRAVAGKVSQLGLKQDRSSAFFKEWQARAAAGKVGKKRPAQADVMRRLHADGKLTPTDAQKQKLSAIARARPHNPRFTTAGMTWPPDVLARVGAGVRQAQKRITADEWQARNVKAAKTRVANGTKLGAFNRGSASWKCGWRTVGGQRVFFRSRWEVNYAGYLQMLLERGVVTRWEHEPETFWFEGVKRGAVSYLPDFRVTYPDGHIEFHEVKGWFDARSKTKVRRMAKYHPTVVLRVIDAQAYRRLQSNCGSLPWWEKKDA